MNARQLGILALALVVTGCSAMPDDAPADPPSTGGPNAVGLVNLWRVSDAAGESADTWLRLDVAEFQLWRSCGFVSGSWSATDTLFLGSVTSASDACATATSLPSVGWLEAVTSYAPTDTGWELQGADGTRLATLRIDGAPKPIASAASFYAEPPVVTPATRQALRPPAALPPGLDPATAAFLRGRWVPAGSPFATDPHVSLDPDGAWTGSDGCNGADGRWVVDGTGWVLTTSGAMTEIGCDGAPVPGWVAMARRAAADGDVLVLLGQDGAELGRLAKA